MYFINMRRNQDKAKGLKVKSDDKYGDEWAKLSHQDKMTYKDKARGGSGRPPPVRFGDGSLAPFDVPQWPITNPKILEQDLKDVEQCVNAWAVKFAGKTRDETMKRSFILASCNVLVRTDEHGFLPLELGLVKYSIEEGVIAKYHVFTYPGDVPMGYYRRAMDHQKSTHKLPIGQESHPTAIGQSKNPQEEYTNMMTEMIMFMDDCKFEYSGRHYYLIFTDIEMIPQLKGVFEWICKKTRDPEMWRLWDANFFRFIDMGILIQRLYHSAGIESFPLQLCTDFATSSEYDYKSGGCEFHEEMDNTINCALGACLKWAYLISENLLPYYPVKPLPNKHLPVVKVNAVLLPENDAAVAAWNQQTPAQRPKIPDFKHHPFTWGSPQTQGWASAASAGPATQTRQQPHQEQREEESGAAGGNTNRSQPGGFPDSRPATGFGRGVARVVADKRPPLGIGRGMRHKP